MASSSILKFILVGEDKTGPAFKSAASGMDLLSKKSQDVGKAMSLGITAPLAGIAAVGIKTASEFGVTMASMQVNARDSMAAAGVSIDQMRELALKMGADTVYSANEAGQAMLELSKAGVGAGDIQSGALAAAMNLAATEGIALADSATIVSNAMNTFGIKGADAGKVADLLAAGAVASSASVTDLAEGLKYAGATANALKVPMSDTVAALAAMNNAGIDSSTAGTSVNQFLSNLLPTTQRAMGAMADLGIELVGANGELLPMVDIIGVLNEKMKGLSSTERQKALIEMFNQRGARAANVLMQQGVKGYQSLTAEVTKSGVATELANARMSGMAGAIETMKGSLETAALTIGEALAPKVMALSGHITRLVNWFTALDSGTKGIIVNFGIAAAAVGPLLWGFGKAIQLGQGLVSGFQGMVRAGQFLHANYTALSFITKAYVADMWAMFAAKAKSVASWVAETAAMVAHKTAAVAIATASKAMAAAQWLVNAAMTANPIGLVIAALAALALGLKYAWDHSETFREIVTKGFKTVGTAVLTLAGLWLTGMKTMVDMYLGFVETVVSGAAKAFGWVPGIGPKLKEAAAKFGEFRDTVGEQFDKASGKVDEFKGKLDGVDKDVRVNVDVHFTKSGSDFIRLPTGKVIPLATGGIVTRPTLALIGEAGPEAVIPLGNGGNTAGISPLGSAPAGGGGVTVNVYGGMDSAETIARRVQTALLDLKRRQGVNLGLA